MQAPVIAAGNKSAYAQYIVRVKNRDELQKALTEQGIPTAVHYPLAMNKQPAFKDRVCFQQSFVESDLAAQQVLGLPMHPYLTEEQVKQVCQALAGVL